MSTKLQKAESRALAPVHKFWPSLQHLRSEMGEMVGDMMAGNWFNLPNFPQLEQRMRPLLFRPSLNMRKDDTEVLVEAALPGIDKRDIHLTVTRDSLVLRGQFRKEDKSPESKVHRSEMEYSSFYRSLRLPDPVDSSKVKAELRAGVLYIRLPLLNPEHHQRVKVDIH